MKNNFLQVSIGVTIMLFGAGFFIHTLKTATATPNPEMFIQQGANKIGKYMMMETHYSNNRSATIVWDTETGNSRVYYFSNDEGKYMLDPSHIPDNPLSN